MPTLLPRLQVSMTEEQHRLLVELASLTRYSAAGFLRQMLDAATPLLRYAVDEARHTPPDGIPDLGPVFHEAFRQIVDDMGREGYFQQLLIEDWIERRYAIGEEPAASGSERGHAPQSPAGCEHCSGKAGAE
jgi:hypothetical protein